MDIPAEMIGGIGSFLTTTAFIPQAVKVLRTRETHAISLGMYVVFTSGLFFWLAYGWMIGSLPIIVGNTVTLPCALLILLMKIRHG